MAFDVNSVPLSETIIPGLPRCSISVVSSRATRRLEIEVSGIAARHSWVTSSTTFKIRNRRPQANWSWTKLSDQRAIGLVIRNIRRWNSLFADCLQDALERSGGLFHVRP